MSNLGLSDLVVALGLVLVIEGLLWAAFAHYAMRMLEAAASTPEPILRLIGLVTAATGVIVVWLVRG